MTTRVLTEATAQREQSRTFACFGSECTVIVAAGPGGGNAEAAAALAERRLLEWHERFSRFLPDSEINRLNRDPRDDVPVTPLLRRMVEAAVEGARMTYGLVDPTLVGELEQAGYADDFSGQGLDLRAALALVRERAAAAPNPRGAWRQVAADRQCGTVIRPPGCQLDVGGIAKGVFADELAALLGASASFAVDCAGDIRMGGREHSGREVRVASPFDASILHTFEVREGAVATSGIGKRSWIGEHGLPAHHLLDPATGRPAFTGVVQATALAPSGAEAEILAKAAVLSGPDQATRWLRHGGLAVLDDGATMLVEP